MLAKLLQLPNGAHFYRTDLHNHTPFDPAFHCAGWPVDTEDQKRAFAREYIRFAKDEQRLDIIAITDHNDVSWLPYIQEAAREIDLTVFPGVELGAMNGGKRPIHILALFDPATDSETINHFISSLNLTPDDRFLGDRKPRGVEKTPAELLESIYQKQGIGIAAHVSSKSGLFYDMDEGPRVMAYTATHLWAVEIPDSRENLSPAEKRIVNGQADAYQQKPVACLNSSDGRGLAEAHKGYLPIGTRSTRIKLSNFTTEGLRQAFLDHDSRIRLEGEWGEEKHPQILGVIIEGGFLSGEPDEARSDATPTPFMLHLNPNLNTVIGGRGAGKSALIEAIRYAFDLPARTEANQKQAQTLLGNTLGAGAKVTLFYELPDGARYRIERTFDRGPKVYDADSGEVKNVHPTQIWPGGDPIEVYGQKEIYEISKNLAFQLELLDRYVAEELNAVRDKEEEIIRSLQTNAESILRLQRDVDDAQQRLRDLEQVKLELERFKKREVISRLERKTQYDREKTLLDEAGQAVEQLARDLEQFTRDHPPLAASLLGEKAHSTPSAGQARQDLPHLELLKKHADLLAQIDKAVAAAIEELRQRIRTLWGAGEPARAGWQKDYDREEETYQALLREFDDVSADRYVKLQSRRDLLEKLAREVENRQARVEELKTERIVKLAELRKIREREFKVRRDKARQLTNQLGDALRVTVEMAGHRDAYADKLVRLFTGTRLQRNTIHQMARARVDDAFVDPAHLAAAIRAERNNPPESESILAQIYDISPALRTRLTALEDEMLFALETYRIPDRPDIRLKVGGQYRPLNPAPGEAGLSTGQKCTAVLSLILLERDTPLVIDQPEDDLDNQFIFAEIVTTLRREKERRQFIVATHNANIPVSGDAELIAVMEANEKHGWIAHLGSIDNPTLREPVENILEGGREAFKIRQFKYGIS